MMEKCLKMAKNTATTVVMLVATIATTTITTAATVYGASYQDRLKIDHATRLMSSMMETILENAIDTTLTVERLYESAMNGMTYPLDEYSYYLNEEELKGFISNLSGEGTGVGIVFTKNEYNEVLVTEVVENTPAYEAGVKARDVIISIGGNQTRELTINEVAGIIVDSKEEISFEIKRGNDIFHLDIKPRVIEIKSVKVNKFEDVVKKVGERENSKGRYIQISSIGENTGNEFEQVLNELRREGVTEILLDLRDNSGGYLDVALRISELIVPEGVIISTIDNLGKKDIFTSKLGMSPFEKIVVLTNENTASAAELIASALQDSGAATIVGETTYGKGVMQTLYQIGANSGIKLTDTEYFRRNGGKINEVGVLPDIEIKSARFLDQMMVMHNDGKMGNLGVAKELLKELGYDVGEINDYKDAKTEESIKEFQGRKGLNETGLIDVETIDAMNKALWNNIVENDPALQEAYRIFTEI